MLYAKEKREDTELEAKRVEFDEENSNNTVAYEGYQYRWINKEADIDGKRYVIKYLETRICERAIHRYEMESVGINPAHYKNAMFNEANVAYGLKGTLPYLLPPSYVIMDKLRGEKEYFGVAYPYCENSWNAFCQQNIERGTEPAIRIKRKEKAILQILYGIKDYAEKGYIHRDIKPDNIRVEIDDENNENFLVRLIDYDWAVNLEGRNEAFDEIVGGSTGYAHPYSCWSEARERPCIQWDLYSAALLFWYIIEDTHHFNEDEREFYLLEENESMAFDLKDMSELKRNFTSERYDELYEILKKMMGKPSYRGQYSNIQSAINDYERYLKKYYGQEYLSYFSNRYYLKNDDFRFFLGSVKKIKFKYESDNGSVEEDYILLAEREAFAYSPENINEKIILLCRVEEDVYIHILNENWKIENIQDVNDGRISASDVILINNKKQRIIIHIY